MRKFSDWQIALSLAAICSVAYALLFLWMYHSGLSNGATLTQMQMANGGDSIDYINLAHTMLSAHRFALTSTSSPEFFRTPGYPAFLAILFFFWNSTAVVAIAQLFLTAYAVALIYLIGVRYFSRGIAVSAAVLYMLDPTVAIHTWFVLTESLFMALFLSAFYAMELRAARKLLPFAAAGVLFGLAALVRPVGMYVAPIAAFMGAARFWPQKRSAAISFFTVLVFLALIVLPWFIRNDDLSGHFDISSIDTFNLFYFDVPDFESQLTGQPVADIQAQLAAQIGQSDTLLSRSFAYEAPENAIVRQAILAHPVKFAEFYIAKSAQFFFNTSIGTFVLQLHELGIVKGTLAPDQDIARMVLSGDIRGALSALSSSVPILLERIFWLLALLLAAWETLVAIWQRKARAAWIAGALVLILAFAILTGPVATPRYRIPVEPFLFLLACAGIADIARRIRMRKIV